MEAKITVSEDRTCKVGLWHQKADVELASVSGLTPEQSVQVKALLEMQFADGKYQHQREAERALFSIAPARPL